MVKSSKSNTSGNDQVPEVTAMYTDGACSGNPGPGGWGAIAHLSNGQIHEMGGAARSTTNNRMEIQAAIEILRWFAASPQHKGPALYTDSKYVQDGITKWIKGWKKKNWKTTAGKPVLNQDLWQQLDEVTQAVNSLLETPLQWRYVKGHAGNVGNERCDAIAREFSKGGHPALMTATPWSDENGRSLASAEVPPSTDCEDNHGDGELLNKKGVNSSFSDAGGAMSNNSMDVLDGSKETLKGGKERTFGIFHPTMERLRIADELANNGYWVTTQELACLLDLMPSAIDEKGEKWLWRNWSILKVCREDSPTLWQLERVD
ncbi:MAG: ribonuclease HI [Cyanobacteria bacterium P01_F01_bin.150]